MGKTLLMELLTASVGKACRRMHFDEFIRIFSRKSNVATQVDMDQALRPVHNEIDQGVQVLALEDCRLGDACDVHVAGQLLSKLFSAEKLVVLLTSIRAPDVALCT